MAIHSKMLRKLRGSSEFVAWVAMFRTDEEKKHNNNISSVRTFMHMFADSNRPLSMRLLTSPDQIIKYIDLIKEQRDYVPKTRLQKIEALKKAIKWLKACSYRWTCHMSAGRIGTISIVFLEC